MINSSLQYFDDKIKLGLSLLCSKIYLLFLPKLETSQNFSHHSYFIPIVTPIIPLYFIVSMIISKCRLLYRVIDCFISISRSQTFCKLGGGAQESLSLARRCHSEKMLLKVLVQKWGTSVTKVVVAHMYQTFINMLGFKV